jgi:hypothetical protein
VVVGTTKIPGNPDAWLNRAEAAAALTAHGLPTKPAGLAAMATRGGGPPFKNWGARTLYRWGDVWEWAQKRLNTPRRRRSETATQAEAPT